MANRTKQVVAVAIVFELALGFIGWGLAHWAGEPLGERLRPSSDDLWRALVALVPMAGLLMVAMRSEWRPLAELRRQVAKLVADFFPTATWPELMAVSIAAGAGEELLFRGGLQSLAVQGLGPAGGVIAASLVFGAAHAASRAYFVLATLVGLYLGWLAEAFDDLTTPIIVHALYDFVALVQLQLYSRRSPALEEWT